MAQLQAVLFDIDGTLLDSNDAHAQVWVETLAEFGYDVSFGTIRRLIGMGGDNLLPDAVDLDSDSPRAKEITKRRSEAFKERFLKQLRPFPEAAALLARVRAGGRKVVVATSSKKDEAEKYLEIIGAAGLVDEMATDDDAENSKPAPDIVEVAVRKAGLTPDQVVLVGDTPYDILSGAKAGVRTIALRCGGWHDADLTGAVAIFDDPADLLAHISILDDLPAAVTPNTTETAGALGGDANLPERGYDPTTH